MYPHGLSKSVYRPRNFYVQQYVDVGNQAYIDTNAINTNSGRYGIQSMARNQETWGAILRQKNIKKSSNDLFLGLFPGSFEVILIYCSNLKFQTSKLVYFVSVLTHACRCFAFEQDFCG